MSRRLWLCIAVIALCGCAGPRQRVCANLMGEGWKRLTDPALGEIASMRAQLPRHGVWPLWFVSESGLRAACLLPHDAGVSGCGADLLEFEFLEGRWVLRPSRQMVVCG